MPSINYLPHATLNKKLWDECLNNSGNDLVYGHCFYLDMFAPAWDGLVQGDYEAVMPLPNRKKWGMHYLFQPFLTPMLGVFGKNITEGLVSSFLDSIPQKFKLWDISLNPANKISIAYQKQFLRPNYVLDLNRPYDKIRAGYSDNIIRNISKAEKNACVLQKGIGIDEIIAICEKEWPRFTKVEPGSFASLKNHYPSFSHLMKSYGVYHPAGKLLSACAFLVDEKRAYYWLVGNEAGAREFGTSSMLVDAFIKDHAGNELLLDFEGSDTESIAGFYQKFGAGMETYTTIYRNLLPFPLRMLKREPAYYRRLIS